MNISDIKNKKPWFVPKWFWNQAVNTACDAAKATLKIEKVGEFTGNAAMDGLAKAIDGKDPNTIEMVCTTVENGSTVFVRASAAAKDGVITVEEKKEVGSAINGLISALVPQSAIDDKIDEVRNALLFG